MTLTLHDYELSADCYTLRLMLAILGRAYETVAVDIHPGEEHKSQAFLRLNPAGTVPVLDDGGTIITDTNSALIHLAQRYDPAGLWYPGARDAEIAPWLDCARALAKSSSLARDAIAFATDADLPAAQAEAHRLLRALDAHLWFAEREGEDWLVPGAHPTIADIAVFPHVVLSEEAGVPRLDYPAVRRWLDRVKRIKGFTVMSGVFPAGPAA